MVDNVDIPPEPPEKIPDWLQQVENAPVLTPSNSLTDWLLRPPHPSKTSWFLFCLGAAFLVVLICLHLINSLPFIPNDLGGVSGCLYFMGFYGAELLPRRARIPAAFARSLGLCGLVMLIVYGLFGKSGLWWAIQPR